MTGPASLIGLGVVVAVAAGPVYAASTPEAACTDRKTKAAGKKAADILKALGKNVKKPNQAKLAADISKAQSKFTKSFTKAENKGGCATTDDADAIEAKVDAFAFGTVASFAPRCGDGFINQPAEECDGTEAPTCAGLCQLNCKCPVLTVCGNGVLETGETCDPPCGQGPCGVGEICGTDCACTPALPCDCGTPDPPTTLEMTTVLAPGTCGMIENASGSTLLDLNCGNTYVGGGLLGSAPVATPTSLGTIQYNVACCNGTSIALAPTTVADTGSIQSCSSEDCLWGAPVPTLTNILAISVCSINLVERDAFGALDCATGDALIDLPVRAPTFLTGDLLLNRCDGGPHPGGECSDDSDCAPGGTCEDDNGYVSQDPADFQPCPICNPVSLLCNGGPNDGLPCTPGTPEINEQYPTSSDCPPPTHLQVALAHNPFRYETGTPSKEALDGQFCGYCRDVQIEGSNCFDGNPDTDPSNGENGCPDSGAIANCQPGTFHGSGGTNGTIDGCGTAIPCTSDADCVAPYETCQQRTAGASNLTTATKITQVGSAAGDLKGRVQKDVTLSSVYCLPPTFSVQTDNNADFPGPGSVGAPATLQLLPEP